MNLYILFTFLFFFILLGILAGKRLGDDKTEGYFLSSRNLNRWQVGISAGATANSGFIVVGAVGMGYTMGMSALLYPLAWLLGDLAFWYLFAPKIRNNEAVAHSVTIPQTLNYNHNSPMLRIVAGLVILILLTLYAASQFIASVKVVSSFTDISQNVAIAGSFIFVMFYTVWGGFKSSVWTDIAQGVMMFLLTAGVLIWGVLHIGGIGIFIDTIATQGKGYLDILGGRMFGSALAFIFGFAFTGFGFSMSQPQVVTRLFAAYDTKEVEAAKWIYIGFLHFTWMGMVLIGMIAKILMPELQDAETALPQMAKTFFPDAIVGAVFAAMIATILSSVDSILVASASALSVDFGFDQKLDKSKRLWLYRLSVLFIGALALMFALFSQSTVFAVVVFVVSVMTASIGAAMTLVILNLVKEASSVLLAVIVGLVVSVIWRVLELQDIISEGFIGFVIAVVVAWLYDLKKSNSFRG